MTNNGPDTADGSITVSDVTDALPEGVTITGITGEGWNCAVPVRDADTGVTTFECERTDTTESLASGESFPVIEVEVSTDDDPIIITDVIPDGINGVTNPSNDDWTATLDTGDWPAAAGDTITWTYTGTRLAVGAAPTIELTGVIDAAWTGGEILNTTIEPGPTPDPDPENNDSTVPTEPADDTTLGITKTLVVKDGNGNWVPVADPDVDSEFNPGMPLSYLVTVVNYGAANARNVQVADEVPAGLTYASYENVEGDWSPNSDGTVFTLQGTQQVGEENAQSFVMTFNTDPALDPEAEIENLVRATADNLTNTPEVTESTDPSRLADLSIEKTHRYRGCG